jgi:hypothetical protein
VCRSDTTYVSELGRILDKVHTKRLKKLYKKAESEHVKFFTEDRQLYEAEGRLEEAMDVYRGVYNWRRKNSNLETIIQTLSEQPST